MNNIAITILTASEFNDIRNYLSGSYILGASIDLSGYTNWEPIGTTEAPFVGKLDGSIYTISNLTIDMSTTDNVGLFGVCQFNVLANAPHLKNVNIVNADVVGQDNVGALAGKVITNDYVEGAFNLIENCSSTGAITGRNNIGGLVGYAEGIEEGIEYRNDYYDRVGRISESYSLATVSGTGEYIGGLVGYMKYLHSYRSHATGIVTGGDRVGGLIGYFGTCSCEFTYATGNVTGNKCAGGLIGQASSRPIIRKSYAEGDVTGIEEIEQPDVSYTGIIGVGGLVGFIAFDLIERCYAKGNVTGKYRVGGLIGAGTGGNSSPSIGNSFAQGNVSATREAGGIIGYTFPSRLSIRNVYCTGSVTASAYGGVVIGRRGAPYFEDDPIGEIIFESPPYYNSDINTGLKSLGGEGKTTNELGIEETYDEDWLSFSVNWVIDQDENPYPILKDFYDPLGIVISAIKGTTAQGLVCAYTLDGATYYRKFDGSTWATAVIVPELPVGADTLNTFKTNDGRLGFIADVDGAMSWALTEQDNMTIQYTRDLPAGTCGNLIQENNDDLKLYYINTVQSLSKSEIMFLGFWNILAFNSVENMSSDSYISRLKAKYFDEKIWFAWRSRGQHRIFAQNQTFQVEETIKLASGSITIRQDTPVVSVSLEVNSFDITTEETTPEIPSDIGYQEVISLTEIPEGYIGIYTVENLLTMTENMAGNYIQMADINLTNFGEWTPLNGPPNGLFEGVFDGNGYKMTGFAGVGLFTGTHPTGIIKNIRFIDVNINKPNDDVSVIVNQYHSGKIQNCYVSGNISGQNCSGIAIGNYSTGEISNCTVNTNITGIYSASGIAEGNYADDDAPGIFNCIVHGSVITTANLDAEEPIAGGLLAGNYSGKLHDCYTTCVVRAAGHAGGLCGQSYSDNIITNCYATGNVTGAIVGGLIGQLAGAGADNCYAAGNVTAEGELYGASEVGGFAGSIFAPVSKCYATGNITGGINDTGGFAGFISGVNIDQCYAIGNVSGQGSIGGFVGLCWDSLGEKISNCFALGDVLGSIDDGSNIGVGGFVGMGGYTVENCYSIGKVTSIRQDEDTGGFVGWHLFTDSGGGDGTVTLCYYDSETSGQSDTHGGTPKTTAEMKLQSTFSDWDFNITWKLSSITDGYPALIWQMGNDEYIPNYPPSSKLQLNFKSGDSDPYPMGIYYVDRTNFGVGNKTTSVTARNSVGKFLKNQSFDERNIYNTMSKQEMLMQIIINAGITNYFVGTETNLLGMEFPPNKDILSGINDILNTIQNWQIREEPDGKVVIAENTDLAFTQPGTYTFYRNRDVFSRKITKDDNDTYGRVCVHTSDFSIKVYRSVSSNLGWLPPAQKTFYQQVPNGTTSISAALLATEIADRLSNSGEVEEFVGAIRPHLLPGDFAQIIDEDGPNLLGIITTVIHEFGENGIYTQFTVDSGGKINKPLLSDYLKQINSGTITSKIIS